ncbi:YIP1 family protein [Shouchella miscanthi]|uniref:YIP1 family protein n=1 Tax=Shouchella miscanthi TaxID=2598861 RepID=A0ABU6NFN7_9BACI|nr:YIP1 family protein [Shouchella miscanthi]MED4126841.1 YIP1 family protein [Shouchella miscanthi]
MKQTNPWLAIWVAPRQTMKDTLKSDIHKQATLILSIIFGGLTSFWFSRSETLLLASTGNFLPLVITIIIGAFTGPILYYGFSFAFGHVGGWYGGNGDVKATRKVFVYALFMPGIFVGLINLILFGLALLTLQAQTPILRTIVSFGSVMIDLTVVWVFAIFLIAYSEAQKIGILKALLVIIAMIGCLAGLYIVVDLLAHLLIG